MVKPAFQKMHEIGEQFEIDFKSFNSATMKRKDLELKNGSVKATKTAHLTQSEWNFL